MTQCHNHQHCIDDALHHARNICQQAGVKLTPLREQVLMLIWQSHKPLGAYDIIDMLATVSNRRIAPPTVYRTLEFLLELGVIHRINSLNAYIGCPTPNTEHPGYFLICKQCHTVNESNDEKLLQQITRLGHDANFQIQKQWLEVLGLCQHCQTQQSATPPV